MKRKKSQNLKGLLFSIMWVLAIGLSAQNITVSGMVTDGYDEAVIGATVVVVGNASHGTVTDIDGNYTLNNVPSNATLQFSFVGMTTQTAAVNGRTTINIVLDTDTELLDEIVVTALGMKRSSKALGYSMTELKGDDLNTNLINPVSALQGKVAGVEIAGSDGGLFGSTKIQSLIKVQIPQALPTIMTGVNQTLMMAMSMVVTTSMIGASGLGMEVLIAVNRVEMGRGLVSGSAVVIIAIILDRITQGMIKRSEVGSDGE